VGGPSGNGASEATTPFDARGPALALIDSRGVVVRLTDTFRAGFASEGSAHLSIWDFLPDPDQRSRLGRVLEGRLLRADLALPSPTGSVAAEAEAVLDAAVMRHALLTVAPSEPDADPRSGADVLLDDGSVVDSPAIVWIKDLSGRYLRINRRYTERLEIDDASILGKTDAELGAGHVVPEPRSVGHRDGGEPAQLEYTVDAVGRRPALTVLRFPIHGLNGAAVAVCGVAASVPDAAIARSEAERLLRLERWAGLSATAIRAELIQEWQLAELAELESAAESPPPASRPRPAEHAAVPETAAKPAELERFREEVAAAQAAAAALERRLGEEAAARAELERRLADEVARSAELRDAAAVAAQQAHEVVSGVAKDQSLITELQAAVEAQRRRAEGAEQEVGLARGRADTAAREIAAALGRVEDTEREIVAIRARAEAAEREVGEARARADATERDLAEARARVDELERASATSLTAVGQVSAERAARAALEERVAEARRRAEETERELAAVRTRAEAAEHETAAQRDRAEAAENEVAAQQARADGSERDLVDARARVEELARLSATAAAEVERANAERAARAEVERRSVEGASEKAAAYARRAEAAAELARERAEGLESALASSREEASGTQSALSQARAQIADLQAELSGTRAEYEAARGANERLDREIRELAARPPAPVDVVVTPASSVPAVEEPAGAVAGSAFSWSPSAQRSLTSALAHSAEWRTGLKDALRILGTEAGWDAVIAWCPDERGTSLRCAAMWMSSPQQLALFETATWQRRQSPGSSQVGRAAAGEHAAWVGDLSAVADPQLAAAAGEGMQGALLIPMRHEEETSGVLQMLTSGPETPGPDVATAMEAVALQLAHLDYLLRRGAEPRWRVGRL
jgi:hypothetical protein